LAEVTKLTSALRMRIYVRHISEANILSGAK